MDHHDHDGLDGGTFSHMFSGAVAGVTEHVLMFPVDTIKTRMQVFGESTGRSKPQGIIALTRSIIRQEGAMRLMRGAPVMALGAGPAHAVYFSVYERAKLLLSPLIPQSSSWHPAVFAASGASATMVSEAIMGPCETVKQRMQIRDSPYRSIVDCIRNCVRTEGVRALFRSYPTALVMNVPYAGVHFAVYEVSCEALRSLAGPGSVSAAVHFSAGAIAGALAAAATTPLDVAKTRLQTQSVATSAGAGAGAGAGVRYVGLLPTLRAIVQESGLRGLLLGVKPRMLFFAPAAAISWTTYEAMKSVTRHWRPDDAADQEARPK